MPRHSDQPLWHLLQVSDVLDVELATALAETVPLIAWEPQRTFLPGRVPVGNEHELIHQDSTLRIRKLPLLRGFTRAPLSLFAQTGSFVTARLLQQTPDPKSSPLVCTVPFFSSVAERWPGPVVYWLTDLIAEYSSADRKQVERLDRRMCEAASLICPNSQRIANYLIEHAGCDPAKIVITPNATRASNLLRDPLSPTTLRPTAIKGIDHPTAGIIGNLAGNMDWLLLEKALQRTPWLSWVFVGPTTMQIADPAQRTARKNVMQQANAYFVGRQAYGDLAAYARSFDVAVLPYRRHEPTYSGSSTRFYEHLAACRPMIATRGLDELVRKPPLLQLVDAADELVQALASLKEQNFNDGLFEMRWRASLEGTWQVRAETIKTALMDRLHSSDQISPELWSAV